MYRASSTQKKSIHYHLYALTSSLTKGATRFYVTKFGVGLPEMRILSTLGREGQLAAHQLVALTAMDKALISRVLATLRRRTYVVLCKPDGDSRRGTWGLTQSGQDLVSRLRPVWKQREAVIQADLSQKERDLLADMLERLFVSSERLRAEEASDLTASRRSSRAIPLAAESPTVRRPKLPLVNAVTDEQSLSSSSLARGQDG